MKFIDRIGEMERLEKLVARKEGGIVVIWGRRRIGKTRLLFLDAIGLGAHRLSEIATRIGQPSTSLVRPVQRLLEMDLIKKEIPFGSLEHHSKRTLYKIKDPFP